jgi:hypothetical protein
MPTPTVLPTRLTSTGRASLPQETPGNSPEATLTELLPSPEPTPIPYPGSTLDAFPLAKGTKWIYSYKAYQPKPTDPTQITQATFYFKELVFETQLLPGYYVAHVHHTESLIQADPDWIYSAAGLPVDYWYLVRGAEVFENGEPLDLSHIQPGDLLLDYVFPLAVGNSWCPFKYQAGQRIDPNCTYAGETTVAGETNFDTPAGNFKDCYELTNFYNSGGVTTWLCSGVGIVAEKYDHAGSRFGFQQTLIQFSKGSP